MEATIGVSEREELATRRADLEAKVQAAEKELTDWRARLNEEQMRLSGFETEYRGESVRAARGEKADPVAIQEKMRVVMARKQGVETIISEREAALTKLRTELSDVTNRQTELQRAAEIEAERLWIEGRERDLASVMAEAKRLEQAFGNGIRELRDGHNYLSEDNQRTGKGVAYVLEARWFGVRR